MQPAAPERRFRRFGIVPVAVHYDLAAHLYLPDLARRQGAFVRVGNPDLDIGEGPPRRRQTLLVTGVVHVRDLLAPQAGDRHRAFALAVDLDEFRAPELEGALGVGHIHRPAAIDDRAQVRDIRARRRRVVDQALHHGRRGEEAAAPVVPDQLEYLLRVEPAVRHHLGARADDIGNAVAARSVAERRGMQDRIALGDVVHIGEIAERAVHQVAVRKRRALRPAGRAAGIEQPGIVGRRDIGKPDPLPFVEGAELRLARHQHAFHIGQTVADRSERIRKVRRYSDEPRARIPEYPGKLAGVQAGIDRHGAKARMPDAVQQLDELGAVLHRDRHTVARLEAGGAQRAGDGGSAAGERAVVGMGFQAPGERKAVRSGAGGADQQGGQIHAGPPAGFRRQSSKPWPRTASPGCAPGVLSRPRSGAACPRRARLPGGARGRRDRRAECPPAHPRRACPGR